MGEERRGMNSRRLSERTRQPGHDRTFTMSEENFVAALNYILPSERYRVVDHPRDLARLFGGRYGVVPEASVEYIPTGRKMYFEVKKQGPAGNADERACKHHTVQFYKTLSEFTGLDYHPFCTIMCESLAVDERYVLKHPYFFEEDHYFLWKDYDATSLRNFLLSITRKFLAPDEIEGQEIPR